MSDEEKEALEKFTKVVYGGEIWAGETYSPYHIKSAFLSGYRACRRVQAMEQLIEAGAEQMEQEERK